MEKYEVDVGELGQRSKELFEDLRIFTKSINGKVSEVTVNQLISEVNLLIRQCNLTVSAFGKYLHDGSLSSYKVRELDNLSNVSIKETTIKFEDHLMMIEGEISRVEESFKKGNVESLNNISDRLQRVKAILKEIQAENERNSIVQETILTSNVNELKDSSVVETQNNANSEKEAPLRKKFDIDSEEDFDKLLAYYAQANKDYYSKTGKRSEEEVKKRRNINAQFKRVLNKKAQSMPQNENGEEFSSTLKSIESGNVFSYAELKQVAENKQATITLFNIMATGVYEKDGQRIRLTQKQRVALASTLEIVSGMRLDMDKTKKATNANKVQMETENVSQQEA